jgi:hypothetical protein
MVCLEMLNLHQTKDNRYHLNRKRRTVIPNEWPARPYKPEDNPLLTAKDYPHYFKSTYMGGQFAMSLLEVFYTSRNFAVAHPLELCDFLKDDRFDTACIPAEYLRNVMVDVTLNGFNVKTGNPRRWTSPKFTQPVQQHYMAAVKGLDSLKCLRHKNKTRITLRVDCFQKEAAEKFAEVLMPFVYDMKDAGVTLDVRDTYSKYSNPFDYSMARAVWEKKIHSHSAFVSQRSDFKMLQACTDFIQRDDNVAENTRRYYKLV